MQILFLGSTASIPDVGDDCPSFLVNEKYLFDCGWNVVESLRSSKADMSKLRYLFFTHMHHDHYLGLAGLLFYMIHRSNMCSDERLSLDQLTIVGPEKDVERVLERTYSFLQLDLFYPDIPRPKVLAINAGDSLQLEDMTIMTSASLHPVQALSYRLTDGEGKKLAITGDTSYQPWASDFFVGCDGLIHDATLATSQDVEPAATRKCGHSTIFEAVKTAEDARIPVLFPMHMSVEICQESAERLQPNTEVMIVPVKRGRFYQL